MNARRPDCSRESCSYRKARISTDKQADVTTQQKADVVISAKEKGAGDAKTERYPQ